MHDYITRMKKLIRCANFVCLTNTMTRSRLFQLSTRCYAMAPMPTRKKINRFPFLDQFSIKKTKKSPTEKQEAETKCISIFRYDPECDEEPYIQEYEVDPKEFRTKPLMLDVLLHIKNEIDPTLTFRRSCREGICGSCSMNINGVNRLACIFPMPRDDIKVFPLPHQYVIKDLVVDMKNFYDQYKAIQPYLRRNCSEPAGKRQLKQSIRDRAKLDGLIECILCACCSTSCPSYWWHGNKDVEKSFYGPAALLQAYRWIIDSRDEKSCDRLSRLNGDAAFKCHTIINCTNCCPKNLNPAKAISEIKRMIGGHTEKEIPDMLNIPVTADDPNEWELKSKKGNSSGKSASEEKVSECSSTAKPQAKGQKQ